MITARHATPRARRHAVPARRARPGRRRLVREELLAGLVLVVALLVTVLLLGLQWLDGGSSSVTPAAHLVQIHGGTT